jgi:hypothetical protein
MSPSLKKRSGPVAVATLPVERQRDKSTDASTATNASTVLYGTTILLSAFLMFQVQLVLGKFVLPRFGGGPSVWSTSLLVFQILLLIGYGYVAVICAKLNPRVQGKLHLFLLAGSAVAIALATSSWRSPILPGWSWKLQSGVNATWQIASLLIAAVGFQCVLLSSTSPLLQRWISNRNPGSTPYRLYALSNLGSMLGLLSYPFLVERFLTLSAQAWVWAGGYAVFLVGAGRCAFLQMRHPGAPVEIVGRKRKKVSDPQPRFLWLALAAAPPLCYWPPPT